MEESVCSIKFEAQIEKDGELRREEVVPDAHDLESLSSRGFRVPATEITQAILGMFKEGSPLLEMEADSDPDASFELKGFDHLGNATTLPGAAEVDLRAYRAFRVTPRPRVGR